MLESLTPFEIYHKPSAGVSKVEEAWNTGATLKTFAVVFTQTLLFALNLVRAMLQPAFDLYESMLC